MITGRPGDGKCRRMPFYDIVWRRDGEEIFRCARHAANEADAIAGGERDFAKHIKRHVQCDLEGTTVEVRLIASRHEET
jgi:uncharacterized C2H2 Zn-finger protein